MRCAMNSFQQAIQRHIAKRATLLKLFAMVCRASVKQNLYVRYETANKKQREQ